MQTNPLGLIVAVTAFLSIWAGHVAVRKIEAKTVHMWKPTLVALILGLTLEFTALALANHSLSAVCGILGVTLLWDAFEFWRQAKRVRIGHAPANPNNPRHAAWLAEANSHATTTDLLKRDPVGRLVSPEEAIRLVSKQ
jgi:hypothetical protein